MFTFANSSQKTDCLTSWPGCGFGKCLAETGLDCINYRVVGHLTSGSLPLKILLLAGSSGKHYCERADPICTVRLRRFYFPHLALRQSCSGPIWRFRKATEIASSNLKHIPLGLIGQHLQQWPAIKCPDARPAFCIIQSRHHPEIEARCTIPLTDRQVARRRVGPFSVGRRLYLLIVQIANIKHRIIS